MLMADGASNSKAGFGGVGFRVWGLGFTCSRKRPTFFKELYIETLIRNPKKVGLFGYR